MTTQNLTDNYQLNTEWPNLFKLLNKNELEILDANKIEVNYQAGEIIRKQSAPLTHIIVYVTGLAKLYIEAIGKKNIILRLIKPGNLVGGPGFYFDLRHHYTIKALLDSSTYFIHIDLFRDLLNKNKNFGYEFNKELSKNTLVTYDRLVSLTQKQMAGRMADLLIYLSAIIYNNTSFVNDLSKDDMSEMAGMSKDNITRILKEFQQKRIVKIKGKVFELLNMDSLYAISNKGFY